ncbi:MAG: CoA transferase [Chloroflexi bacterium]|nr:CoA transferase [Chloroflexota bacterium]
MTTALDGLLVLDTTTEFWAALGVALLGDFGAHVIKIEAPSSRERDPDKWDHLNELANRNKFGLALDTDPAAGRAALEGLVTKADVFVTDGSIPDLEERRLDYSTLAALKPGLIYAHGSGFGPKGPDRDAPAIDELAAARTGIMPVLQQPGQPPVYTEAGQMYSSVMLAFGVMAALRHRAQTGEGQRVDASLFAGNMYGASLDIQAYLAMGGERFLQPVSRLDAGNPMSGVLYRASDGRWVTLTMPDTDRWWPDLAEIVGLDVDDDRFNSHEKRCEVNRLELLSTLEDAFSKQPSDHWRRELNARQMSADVIEDYGYPEGDRSAVRNRYIIDIEDERLGTLRSVGFPIHMSESPAELTKRAPTLGQHSAEVPSETLGYSADEIAQLRTDGVIAGVTDG